MWNHLFFLTRQNETFIDIIREMLSFENVTLENLQQAVIDTLFMTFWSTLFAFIIGIVLGILLYLSEPGRQLENAFLNKTLSFIINVFRSIPFIILIVLLIPFTLLVMKTMMGPRGALPALIIAAGPFYARLVWIALNEIPRGVVEAAESMGANTWEIITKVLIPESLPALVSGITVTAISVIGFTAVAGAIGARGLGDYAYMVGHTRNQKDVIFVATITILIIVFIVQAIGDLTAKAIDKR